MTKKQLCSAVAAAFLLASGASQVAAAEIEREPNDAPESAQRLIIGASGSVEVTGILGALAGDPVADVDFYSFHGRANNTVTIDIDDGIKTTGRSLDTVLGILGPDGLVLRQIDDASAADEGSVNRFDARLDAVTLPADGIYTVIVASSPRKFQGGSAVTPFVPRVTSNGSYKLIISGVTPSTQQVNIDIKPGVNHIARVNPNSKGDIAVAVLSSPTFDALKVDRSSLTFGPNGDEQSFERCLKHGFDVNRDKLPDLICQFDIQKAAFEVSDEEGVLRGTVGGMPFEGRGWLKVIPVKKKHKDRDRDHRGRDDDDRDDD